MSSQFNNQSPNFLAALKSKYALFAALLVVIFSTAGVYFVATSRFVDFPVYYWSGVSLLNGRTDLYAPDFSWGILMDYRYPPLFLILFCPLSLLPFPVASFVWWMFCLLQIAACAYFVQKLVEESGFAQKFPIIWLVVLFLVGQYFVMAIKYGNAHLLVTCLLFGSFYFVTKRKTVWLAALLIALAISFKIVPVLTLPYFVIKRRWKYLGFVAAFLVILNLLPALYFGFGKNLQLLENWYQHIIVNHETDEKSGWVNLSLKGQLKRYATDIDYVNRAAKTGSEDVDYRKVNVVSISEKVSNRIWMVVSAIIYAAIFLGVLLLSRNEKTDAGDDGGHLVPNQKLLIEYSLLICLILLIGPLTIKIYYVMMLLPAFVLTAFAFNVKSASARVARYVVIFIAALNLILPLLPGRDIQRLLLVLGIDFFVTVLLTAALVFVWLYGSAEPSAAAEG